MSSEKEKVKCVFCVTVKAEQLNLFSEQTLAKCRNILRLRRIHNLKYKNIILSNEIFDLAYHISCYRTFTALKKNFILQMPPMNLHHSLVLLCLQLSNHRHQLSSIVDDTILSDSLVENIHVPETVDVGDKDIKAEVDQSLEEGRCEDSAATSSTVQPSDTGDVAIQNLCFFCNKKGSKRSLRLSRCALQKKINLEKLFYQILIQIVIFSTKP